MYASKRFFRFCLVFFRFPPRLDRLVQSTVLRHIHRRHAHTPQQLPAAISAGASAAISALTAAACARYLCRFTSPRESA